MGSEVTLALYFILSPYYRIQFRSCPEKFDQTDLSFRWNQSPLSEAMRHHHPDIVGFIKRYLEKNPNAGSIENYYEQQGVTTV